MKQKKKLFNLATALRDFFRLQAYEDIISWSKKNINFSNDVSAERNYLDYDSYPYQIDIIKQWTDLTNIKEVVVVCPEQMRENQYLHNWVTLENDIFAFTEFNCLSI